MSTFQTGSIAANEGSAAARAVASTAGRRRGIRSGRDVRTKRMSFCPARETIAERNVETNETPYPERTSTIATDHGLAGAQPCSRQKRGTATAAIAAKRRQMERSLPKRPASLGPA